MYGHINEQTIKPSLEVIKLEFILKLKINCTDWQLADMCLVHSSQSLSFILSLRLKQSFITPRPDQFCAGFKFCTFLQYFKCIPIMFISRSLYKHLVTSFLKNYY